MAEIRSLCGLKHKCPQKRSLYSSSLDTTSRYAETRDTFLVSTDISLDIRQGTWAPVPSHWLRENYWTPMMTGYIITGEIVPTFACTLLSET